jgi:ribose transport system permease protein
MNCCNLSNKKLALSKLRVYIVLIALCLLFTILSQTFATQANIVNILLASATIGLLSIGAALIIGAGGLDLSVGSVLALSAAAASVVIPFLPWPLIIATCLLSGILVGLLNGILVAVIRIPPFIATLGMLSVVRGLALILTDGRPVYGLPDPIVFIGQGVFCGLPIPIWIFIASGIIVSLIMKCTVFGIHTLCIGDNQQAAYTAGVKVQRHKIILYILSGLLASIAGLVFMGRVNAADPSAGLMSELTAITAAILGGTRLAGGKSSIIGAMVGALIMSVLQNGLTLLAVPTYYQQVAIGVVLILAISFEQHASGENHARN